MLSKQIITERITTVFDQAALLIGHPPRPHWPGVLARTFSQTRAGSRSDVGLAPVQVVRPGTSLSWPSYRVPARAWRAAPIIQLCAGCGLHHNASLGVQIDGSASVLPNITITQGNTVHWLSPMPGIDCSLHDWA